jgi:hypothetical protein
MENRLGHKLRAGFHDGENNKKKSATIKFNKARTRNNGPRKKSTEEVPLYLRYAVAMCVINWCG